MPPYKVSSGEFETIISRHSPRRAAVDAIGSLRDREGEFRLGILTGVSLNAPVPSQPVWLSTVVLMEENGLEFRYREEEEEEEEEEDV